MSKMDLQKGWVVGDQVFKTKSEAEDYMRKPQVIAALTTLAENEESAEWIYANKDELVECYRAATIRRVSKADKKALAKSLETLTEENGFLFENKDIILEVFRWPTVKRGEGAENLITAALMDVCGEDENLVDWLIANKVELLEALDAGKVKQQPSQKAMEGLARYREQQAAKKAAAEAAEAAGAEGEDE